MNELDSNGDSPSFVGSLHVPIGLIALAFIFHFFSELRSASKQAEIMRWQLTGLDRQTEQLSAGKRELAGLIMKNDDVVRQAQAIQGQYTAMFTDLLELAKDDKGAKEIVDKWGIKRTGPEPAPAPAAAPAPAPAPAAEAPKADGASSDAKAPALR